MLIDIDDRDTISILKRKIGEKIESTFEMYNGLTKMRATNLVKNYRPSKEGPLDENLAHLALNDEDKVTEVLNENDEVYFELVSQDIWLKFIFLISEIGLPAAPNLEKKNE